MSSAGPHTLSDSPPSIPGLELQEKLGEGGMSVVYKAVHHNLQRTVAVKVVRAITDDEASVAAWLRESRLMASLDHPHVVKIHDAGQVEGHDYLVIEYMAGGSLRKRMRPGRPMPFADVAQLLDHISEALIHIHEQGILHLDLKPENILYTENGQVKIADFGLSVPHDDANVVKDGRFQGTFGYCAPESRAGFGVDARYDVFSLAALAYELFTGRIPGRVYVPAARRNRRLPDAIDGVLQRGLARDPSERFESVADFRNALARVKPARVPRRWHNVVIAGLSILTIALLVAYVWPPESAVQTGEPPAPKPIQPQVAKANRPNRLMVFYDKPQDLSLFSGADGKQLSRDADVTIEKVLIEKPTAFIAHGLSLPFLPTPRPVLAIQSPKAWGFVHPLVDRTLGYRVLKSWPTLLKMVVPPERNLVKASGFDGECLGKAGQETAWQFGDNSSWDNNRQITIDQVDNKSKNSTLLLTSLSQGSDIDGPIGCSQIMRVGPPPGSVLVVRYRARSLRGKANLTVYLNLPMLIAKSEKSEAAERVRLFGKLHNEDQEDQGKDCWFYRSATWIKPTEEWTTYVVICECPPFPTRLLRRNLVILVSVARGLGDKVCVDDVEAFVWEPGSKP